jgi:hypothetical protein
MRDPHVEWLEYNFQTTWIFDNPPPVRWHAPDFEITLHNAVLRADMRAHFAKEEEARAAVEAYLQTWELDIALTYGHREVTFTFKKAHTVDRNPPPPGLILPNAGKLSMTGGRASVSATGEVIRKTYPAVPNNFIAVPDVITMWNRFEGYKAGREPIASMAYFCFTVITYRYGSRSAASKALSIDEAVLKKLSELSTNRGDNSMARKMTAELTPLTPEVTQWLEAIVRALIRRVGEIASGHPPVQLTMAQLPRL